MTINAGAGISSQQLTQLHAEGFMVLTGVLSDQECDEYAADMDRAWIERDLALTSESEEGVRFVDNALHYTARVQRCLTHPLILMAARIVLGPDVRLNLVNGRSPGPGAAGQPLHDLSRRRGEPFDKCNAIWCLDEFTAENGATRVIPGSHLDDTNAIARMADPMLPHPDEVIVEASRGSVIFHNSHLIHSGRPNCSSRERRSIHAAYTRKFIPTHYDWTKLPAEIVAQLSAEMRELLA